MQFVKDLGNEFFWSKMNSFAVGCARYSHGIRFYDRNSNDTVVFQAAGGYIPGNDREFSNRRVIVLHDWYDAYIPAVIKSYRVYKVGMFKLPQLPRPVIELGSYPVDNQHPIPRGKYELTIGGEIHLEDFEYVLDSIGESVGSAAIICSPAGDIGCSGVITKIEREIRSRCRGELYINRHTSDVMVKLLYMSANRLVHCGDAMGGMLHSYAAIARNSGAVVKVRTGLFPDKIPSFMEVAKHFI